MLSNTCKYALRAVVFIAVNQDGEKKIGLKKIAEKLNIPAPFLGKILQLLAKRKILASSKGPNGGFSILKDPNTITVLEIVILIDGDDLFNDCLFGFEICRDDKHRMNKCPVHSISGPIRSNIYDMFNKQTIGQLAEGLIQFNSEHLF